MGLRFKNLEPPYEPQAFGAVFKWALADRVMGRRREAPPRAPVPMVPPDLGRLTSPEPSLTWVGHATWIVRLGEKTILTDPVWSTSLGPGLVRNVAPGVPLKAVEGDVVVVSHNHRDHLDASTIERLVKTAAARSAPMSFVVPLGLGAFFRDRGAAKVTELGWWDAVTVDDLRVTLVPSQHWSQRGVFDRNETLWGGYVLEADGRRVYFAGDTAYFGGFKEIGQRFSGIDAALLPIGAYDPEWFMRKQHMNPEDALKAFGDLGAKLLCAMHWGTFKLTDEPLDEPPNLLEQARGASGVESARVWVSPIGGSRPL